MPAKSKHQQRFFGMVHKCQKTGDCASPEVRKVAKSIDYDDADEFASTKHKGLPAKVEEGDVCTFPYRTTPKMQELIARYGLTGPNTTTEAEFRDAYKRAIGFKEWFYQNESMDKSQGSEQDALRHGLTIKGPKGGSVKQPRLKRLKPPPATDDQTRALRGLGVQDWKDE